MKRAAALLLALAAGSAAAQGLPPVVRLPQPAAPVWRGMLPIEEGLVAAGSPMIYPGPLAVFLASILTHAAIQDGIESKRQQRAQERADAVLAPYREALHAIDGAALWRQATQAAEGTSPLRLWDGSGEAPAAWLEATAVFTMARDESALVLDLALVRHEASMAAPGAGDAAHPVVVRVVSRPRVELAPAEAPEAAASAASEPDAFRPHPRWLADTGTPLADTAGSMLAHALGIALRHTGHDDGDAPMRSHRWRLGAAERVERARRIDGECGRAVLRNLRGWIMSVPVAPEDGCEPGPGF